MVDLAPEGCMSLRDFYDRYWSWRWGGHDPFDELQLQSIIGPLPAERQQLHLAGRSRVIDACLAEAVRIFQWGKIRSFVVPSPSRERRYISTSTWDAAFFPERMFLADTIGDGHGAEFDVAVGRTPFIVEVHADAYFTETNHQRGDLPAASALRDLLIGLVMDGVLRSHTAEEFRATWRLSQMQSKPLAADHDPRKEVFWTLHMTICWLAWRNYDAVREAMDAYRADCWEWFGYRARLPIGGGSASYEVDGEELRPLSAISVFHLGMLEALNLDEREGQQLSIKSAREDLWRSLAEGAVVATGIDTYGDVVQVPSHEWPYIVLEADANWQDRLVFSGRRQKLAYKEVRLRKSDLLVRWPPQQEVSRFFDLSELSWRLLEASIWVGCEGKTLPSQQIADENLEEKGAYALFRALYPLRGLVATGLNRARVREPIPAEYWEMATMDPHRADSMHYVSFIDDELEEEGGQLTPFREEQPRWFGIRLDRDALFSAFPLFAPAVARADANLVGASVRSAARKLTAAKEAIRAVFPAGFPVGLGDKERLSRVNKWLEDEGHGTISLATMKRAANVACAGKLILAQIQHGYFDVRVSSRTSSCWLTKACHSGACRESAMTDLNANTNRPKVRTGGAAAYSGLAESTLEKLRGERRRAAVHSGG